MPHSKPILKPQLLHPQQHNNHKIPQMEMVMQRMMEMHTKMMQVMTHYMVNSGSRELPPRMRQVLDNHSQMIQMIP
jgi:hypothetical protein